MLIQKQSNLTSAWDDVGSIDEIQVDPLLFNGFDASLDSVLDPNDTLGTVGGNTLFSDTCFSDPPFYLSSDLTSTASINNGPASTAFATKRRKVSQNTRHEVNFDLEEDIAAIEAEITAVAQHKRQIPNISLSSSPTLSFQPLFFSAGESEKPEPDFYFNIQQNNPIQNKQNAVSQSKPIKNKSRKRKKKDPFTHKDVLASIANLSNEQMSVVLNILYPNQLKATTDISDLSLDIARLDDVRQGKLRTFLKSCMNKRGNSNLITTSNNFNSNMNNSTKKKKKPSPKRKRKNNTNNNNNVANLNAKELSRAEIFEREEVLILKHVDDEDEFVDIGDSFDC